MIADGEQVPLIRDKRINNRLLLALPKQALERIQALTQFVDLKQGQSIDRVDGPIKYLYFVNSGFISMVKSMRDGRAVEIGGVGIEGVTSPSSLLGIPSAAFDALVQIPGTAFRIERAQFQREMHRDEILSRFVDRYARFLLTEIAQTAACNRLHTVEQRCCRWLLVAHDNALSDRFSLTQEFLAMMLGTQRSGVSLAARMLKKAGLVDYARGQVMILDKNGLKEEACECYQTCRDEMNRLYIPDR